jgi:hypothetical protein
MRLQLAMAFGQGAGVMIADAEALDRLVTEQTALIANANASWHASHWAFIELVRRLGQVSAARAAMERSAVIRWEHIAWSIPAVMELCPCLDRPPVRGAV